MKRLVAIIPHLDTPDETARCLASLRASGRRVDRVIVVDNGSTPPFAERAVSEPTRDAGPTIEVVRSPRNLGFSGGCNLGLDHARNADLVLILNSDVEVEGDCIEKLEAALDGGADLVGPMLLDQSPQMNVESLGVRISPRTGRMRNLTHAGPVDAVVGACMLLRREVLERVGRFDERFFYGFEDVDLCLRARSHGFVARVEPAARARHRLAATIGIASPDRLYYAARNHLLVAQLRFSPSWLRSAAIVTLNVAYALTTSRAPLVPGLLSVAGGVIDHWRGRYGAR